MLIMTPSRRLRQHRWLLHHRPHRPQANHALGRRRLLRLALHRSRNECRVRWYHQHRRPQYRRRSFIPLRLLLRAWSRCRHARLLRGDLPEPYAREDDGHARHPVLSRFDLPPGHLFGICAYWVEVLSGESTWSMARSSELDADSECQ